MNCWTFHPPATMSQAECYQRLRAHLAFLKLTDAAEALPRILDAAREQNLPLVTTLEQLLEVEVAATEDRRLTSRLRFACVPAPGPWPTSTTPPNPASTKT